MFPSHAPAFVFSFVCRGSSPAGRVAGGVLFGRFARVVGNTLYPEWLAYEVGCGLVMLKTEAERRADALQEELARERLKNEVLMQALRGGAR